MFITYCILGVLYAGMLIFSGVLKLRHDAQVVGAVFMLVIAALLLVLRLKTQRRVSHVARQPL